MDTKRLTKAEVRELLIEDGQDETMMASVFSVMDSIESLEASKRRGVRLGVVLEHLGHRLDVCGFGAKLACVGEVSMNREPGQIDRFCTDGTTNR